MLHKKSLRKMVQKLQSGKNYCDRSPKVDIQYSKKQRLVLFSVFAYIILYRLEISF